MDSCSVFVHEFARTHHLCPMIWRGGLGQFIRIHELAPRHVLPRLCLGKIVRSHRLVRLRLLVALPYCTRELRKVHNRLRF
jgi:hypothetical protein